MNMKDLIRESALNMYLIECLICFYVVKKIFESFEDIEIRLW